MFECKYTYTAQSKLAAMYPRVPYLVRGQGPTLAETHLLGKLHNPDVNKLADTFLQHYRNFQKTELCRRIKALVSKLFKEQKVTKIVAFGLGQICSHSRDPHEAGVVQRHYQHGALLAIRDTWENLHKGDFKIYVQDPAYTRQDEAILKTWGITVVNAEMGYQVGPCLLDIFTLVVDFMAKWPVSHVVFEITRPAGILKSGMTEIELEVAESEAIFHYEMTPSSGFSEYVHPVKGFASTKYQNRHYFPGTGV
jgi:hypothetical protein